MKQCNLCEKENKCRGVLCSKCTSKVRRYRIKIMAVEYLGGKCSNCKISYQEVSVYDFHHITPTDKDFTIGCKLDMSWEKIKKELDKCKLLCSNCHRLEHRDISDEFLDYVYSYKSKNDVFTNSTINITNCFSYICNYCSKTFNSPQSNRKFCSDKCFGMSKIKTGWPKNPGIVLEQVKKIGYVKTGKIYNVSDNAVRKYLRKHNMI